MRAIALVLPLAFVVLSLKSEEEAPKAEDVIAKLAKPAEKSELMDLARDALTVATQQNRAVLVPMLIVALDGRDDQFLEVFVGTIVERIYGIQADPKGRGISEWPMRKAEAAAIMGAGTEEAKAVLNGLLGSNKQYAHEVVLKAYELVKSGKAQDAPELDALFKVLAESKFPKVAAAAKALAEKK